MSKRIGLISGLSLILAGPLSAHHSGAGYDMAKTLSASATLKEFRWGAPHSMVVFMVKGADGKQEEVAMASAAPASFARSGFKPRDFKAGDKMQITWHPSKSGATGGTLLTITLPDGRQFGDPEFGPGGSRIGGPAVDRQAADAQFPTDGSVAPIR